MRSSFRKISFRSLCALTDREDARDREKSHNVTSGKKQREKSCFQEVRDSTFSMTAISFFPVVGLQVHDLCADQFYCGLSPAGVVLDVEDRQQRGKGPVRIFRDRLEYVVPPRVVRVFARSTGRTEHVEPPARSRADSMDRAGAVSQERAWGTDRMNRKLFFHDFPQGLIRFSEMNQ